MRLLINFKLANIDIGTNFGQFASGVNIDNTRKSWSSLIKIYANNNRMNEGAKLYNWAFT